MFASIKHGLSLNRQVNFHSFSTAFLFLFQVLTGRSPFHPRHELLPAQKTRFAWHSGLVLQHASQQPLSQRSETTSRCCRNAVDWVSCYDFAGEYLGAHIQQHEEVKKTDKADECVCARENWRYTMNIIKDTDSEQERLTNVSLQGRTGGTQ